jgi:2,5-diamino-6-(ribosylamino)-4(3H)-pyrimidinone 5'-phosphate reductase
MDHFYSDLHFDLPDKRPFVACNMVMSLDGKVTRGGVLQPGSLGSAFDLHTMRVIRSHFDAVLAGGSTVRQHPFYLGVPPELEHARCEKGLAFQPLSVVLTGSGRLDPGAPLFQDSPRPPVIIASAEGAANLPEEIKNRAVVEVLEQSSPDAICALLWQKHQVRRLLVEGGPSTNFQFMQSRLLDEIFITLAPRLVGLRTDLTLAMGDDILPWPQDTELVSVHRQGSELFLRYRFRWE